MGSRQASSLQASAPRRAPSRTALHAGSASSVSSSSRNVVGPSERIGNIPDPVRSRPGRSPTLRQIGSGYTDCRPAIRPRFARSRHAARKAGGPSGSGGVGSGGRGTGHPTHDGRPRGDRLGDAGREHLIDGGRRHRPPFEQHAPADPAIPTDRSERHPSITVRSDRRIRADRRDGPPGLDPGRPDIQLFLCSVMDDAGVAPG